MSLMLLFTKPSLEPVTFTAVANQVVYEPADAAQFLYFIQTGEVRTFQISDGEVQLTEILGPGDWFNPAAFLGNATCGQRAVAATFATIIRVRSDRLMAEVARNSSALSLLVRQLSERLMKARSDAANMVFEDTNTRLLRVLIDLSQTVAATRRPEGVELRISQVQLAQAVGAARETISLALTDLRKQNLLRTGRNRLFFDPDALRHLRELSRSSEPTTESHH